MIREEKEQEADMKLRQMLKNLTTSLEFVGFVDPLSKVYNLTKDLDHFPLVATLLTLGVLNQLTYD